MTVVVSGEVVVSGVVTGVDINALHFRAETNSDGHAVDLIWTLPEPAVAPDDLNLLVLRRVRRYPGLGRRGVVPVAASAADRADGHVAYDSALVEWDIEETRDEVGPDGSVSTVRQYQYRGNPRDRVLVRTIRRAWSANGAPLPTTVRAVDRWELAAGTIYYYTAFAGADRHFSSRTQASALATEPSVPDLFALLPQVDRRRDTQPALPATIPNAEHGRGQLERFLRVVQAHADTLMGSVDALRDVHDVRRVDARLLEAMAAQIGWQLRDHLDEDGQRNEIAYAPAVYRTVGTVPNVAAMVNRLTGWTAEIREFSRSVLLSWDGTRVEQLQAGPAYLDGGVSAVGDPPVLAARRWPRGSVDTTLAFEMFRLRNRAFDDPTAYTYDCGRLDPADGAYARDDSIWFNRETIGVYATPDVATEMFTHPHTWRRVREIIEDFLPLQVRAVLFVRPGLVTEDTYPGAAEEVETVGRLVEGETYALLPDSVVDKIPQWRWLIANDLPSRSVDVAAVPVDLTRRTRHVGVQAGP